MITISPRWCCAALALLYTSCAAGQTPSNATLGIFSGQGDVGTVLHPGAAHYDAAAKTYTITGSGENMWFGKDQFHFAWTRASGDLNLSALIRFAGSGGNNHRKAVLMVRQSLDPGSPAVDVAVHGDGLTSLQFRDASSADTHEVESAETMPARVELRRRGDRFYAYIQGADGRMQPAGASIRVPMSGDVYVGLGVCSHDKDVAETAAFSAVELNHPSETPTGKPVLWSVLETVNVASTDRRVAYLAPSPLRSPAWSHDGASLLVERETGASGTQPLRLHWDETTLRATGAATAGDDAPAQNMREGTAAATPGADTRWVYFSSAETGRMQIWRRHPDGSGAEQVLVDGSTDLSPHPSPDGQQIAFLACGPAICDGHAKGDVEVRVMDLATRKVRTLARLWGGPGTLERDSWSLDGKRLAFVSYEMLQP